MQLDVNPIRITRWLLIVTLVLAILSWITSPFIDLFGLPHPKSLWEKFNLDAEGNFVTWFKSVLLFMAAITTGLIAQSKRDSQAKFIWHWQVLAWAFTLMSIDEIARIHEGLTSPLRNALHSTGFLYYAWIIPAAAIVIAFCALMFRFFLHLPGRLQLGLATGAFVYVLGALGFESLGGYMVSTNAPPLLIPILVTLEECSQMIGSIILLNMMLTFLMQGSTVGWGQDVGSRRVGSFQREQVVKQIPRIGIAINSEQQRL
jgi:hypothetical protein